MAPSRAALARSARPLITSSRCGCTCASSAPLSVSVQKSRRRNLSTTPLVAATATPTNATASDPRQSKSKRKPLTPAQQSLLDSALRVNLAGELAAVRIYAAQTPLVTRREPHLRPLMRHMAEQEAGHLATFSALAARHRVRPSALLPLWSALSTGLGWSTAALGREAAMACTEAVETEIGDHYNAQIRALLEMVALWESQGYEVGDEFRDLLATLRRVRDEELEHLDHAVEHDAKKAQPYWLLTGVIRAGCRGAIWVSERV